MERREIIYDCVLNETMETIFIAYPEQVRQWLMERTHAEDIDKFTVFSGKALRNVSVLEYLSFAGDWGTVSDMLLRKAYFRDWSEAIQFNAILDAMRTVLSVDVPNYDHSMELASETTHLIMTIFKEGPGNVLYFDCVLDNNMKPVFNDTPQKVRSWLKEQEIVSTENYQVCLGKTLKLLSVPEYLGLKG